MLQLSDRRRQFPALPAATHCPTTLSYEFDPLDAAKARELRLIRETGRYDKSPGEDLRNLALGLTGAKGRVVLTVGRPLTSLPETVEELAEQIDAAILAGQALFPINEWAAARIDAIDQSGGDLPVLPSTADEAFDRPSGAEGLARFEACSDEDRMDLLSMYAAPVQLKRRLGSPAFFISWLFWPRLLSFSSAFLSAVFFALLKAVSHPARVAAGS